MIEPKLEMVWENSATDLTFSHDTSETYHISDKEGMSETLADHIFSEKALT